MARTGERFRVLVVDDNAANRELAVATLEDEADLDVKAVEDGATALAALQSWRPDCVLLDARMPGMDGFEVCRRMRALPQGSQPAPSVRISSDITIASSRPPLAG